MVCVYVGLIQSSTKLIMVLLRNVTFDVAYLVNLASLNDRVVTEDSLHTGFQSLRSIDAEQGQLVSRNATISQISVSP